MTVDEVLRKYEPLAEILAAERSDRYDFDDLKQEMMIALWQAAVKRPGDDMEKLGTTVMKRRARALLRGDPQLGEPSHRGRPKDPLRAAHESLEAEIEEHGDGIIGRHPAPGEDEPDCLCVLPGEAADFLRDGLADTRPGAQGRLVQGFRRKFPELMAA